MSHLAGVDASNLRVLKVRHSEARMSALRALEKTNENRAIGRITLDEAGAELDVTVLRDGFNVLYDEDIEEYIGVVNFR